MRFNAVVFCVLTFAATSALARGDRGRNPGVKLKQTFGSEPLELFNTPTGVADDTNNLYIAETGAGVVKKFDPDGNLVRVISSRGNRPGQLNAPVEIDIFQHVLYVSDLGANRVSRFTLDGHFIDNIGVGELDGPRAVTLDEAGTIYVLDEFSDRIVFYNQHGVKLRDCSPPEFFLPNDIFFADDVLFVANANAQNILKLDLDCNVLAVTGTLGSGPGQFNFPRSVFVRDGLLYISDSLNNRVQVLDTDLNFVDALGAFPTLLNPSSTLLLEDGTFVVVESGRHQVKLFAPDDFVTPIQVIGDLRDGLGEFNAPGGMFFERKDNELYVADTNNGRIQVFDFHSGQFKRTFGTPGFGFVPGDLLFVNGVSVINDLVYTTSALHQIVVFDKQGNEVDRIGEFGFGPGQFFFPFDVLCDSQGNFFVSDNFNNRVQKFDPDFNFVQSLGVGLLAAPSRLYIDHRDRVFVTDTNNDLVRVFDGASGDLLSSFGGFGFGDGEFYLPFGVTMDKRERFVIVTDSGNNRISVFENKEGFAFTRNFSSLGSTDTDVFFPSAAIQCGGRRDICVSNYVQSTVKRFELRTRKPKRRWPWPWRWPW